MEEPPVRPDEFISEPPEGFDEPDHFADELIERHVESVEMRSAARHSADVKNHRGPKSRRRGGGKHGGGSKRARRDDGDGDDNARSGLVGALSLGLIISIVFAVIGAVAILGLYGSRSSRTRTPSIEIQTPPTPSTAYPTIQPAPTPAPPPAVYRPNNRRLSNATRQPR